MKFAADPPPAPPPLRFLVAAVILLTALTAVMTYPQILHMRDAVNDEGDPLLNTWALAWVAHELPIAPAHLFDANIFYPERHTLAFSEALLVPGIIVAPLFWAGVGRILIYNVAFLGAMILSGLGTVLLVAELTGRRGPALVAGIIFAFLPFRIDHYPHLQLQQTEWIPLALWSLHRLMRTALWRDAITLGILTACQLLSSLYFGIFLVPYLGVIAVMLLVTGAEGLPHTAWNRRALTPRIVALAAAGIVCLAIVAPVGRGYLAARRVVGERSAEEVTGGSARWRNYLSAPSVNAVYGRWSEVFGGSERRLFPGFVAIALAIAALCPPISKIRLTYGVALLFAFDVSLGFHGLTYPALYAYVLPFRALRIPARMGLIVGFTLAVLAGLGAARLTAGIRASGRRRALIAAVSVLILLEYRSRPLELKTIVASPPEIYADMLRDRGDAPAAALVELPIAAHDPTFMYYSTFHWQYLLNGYSGFFPPSYDRLVHRLDEFPFGASMEAVRGRGARYLLIHGELLNPDRYAQLVAAADGVEGLGLVARRPWQGREISLYRVIY
jgi:hypothetical protein